MPLYRIGRRAQSGFSLVELMVSITLGLLILAGLSAVFVNNSKARDDVERANQQIDNGRYAMQLLSDGLQNAGYLAELDPAPLATPATKQDPCLYTLADLKTALPIAVQGYDNGSGIPSCLTDVRSGTDVLVVRRASTHYARLASACPSGDLNCDSLTNNGIYFQASNCNARTITAPMTKLELASSSATDYYSLQQIVVSGGVLDPASVASAVHGKDCTADATYRRYLVHIYYIANNDRTGDGIPTLKRLELNPSALTTSRFSTYSLVPGVENMQFEYGIDAITSGSKTGTPAVYSSAPDSRTDCLGGIANGCWRNVVAVKIHLLVRDPSATAGYVDNKTYTMGLLANSTTEQTLGPFRDAFRRHVFTSLVRVNNVAGRNLP